MTSPADYARTIPGQPAEALAECYCGRKFYLIPWAWVQTLRTATCEHPECQPPRKPR